MGPILTRVITGAKLIIDDVPRRCRIPTAAAARSQRPTGAVGRRPMRQRGRRSPRGLPRRSRHRNGGLTGGSSPPRRGLRPGGRHHAHRIPGVRTDDRRPCPCESDLTGRPAKVGGTSNRPSGQLVSPGHYEHERGAQGGGRDRFGVAEDFDSFGTFRGTLRRPQRSTTTPGGAL